MRRWPAWKAGVRRLVPADRIPPADGRPARACGGLARRAQTANNKEWLSLAEDGAGSDPKQCLMPHATDVLSKALIPLATTVTAIGLLAFAIYLIRSWLRDNDGPAASAHELLADYREMHRRGELSDEEFRIIKSRMAPRIKGTSDAIRNDDSTDNIDKNDKNDKGD